MLGIYWGEGPVPNSGETEHSPAGSVATPHVGLSSQAPGRAGGPCPAGAGLWEVSARALHMPGDLGAQRWGITALLLSLCSQSGVRTELFCVGSLLEGRGRAEEGEQTGCGPGFGALFRPHSHRSRKAAALICLFQFLAQLMRLVFVFLKTVCAENTLWHPWSRGWPYWPGPMKVGLQTRLQKALCFLLQVTLSRTQPSPPLPAPP